MTDRTDHRGRPDVRAARRVVQAHVPRDDRHAERVARGRDARDGPLELPRARRTLRIADVEAVGDRERRRARADDVACRLGHGAGRADERIDRRDARLRVDRERDPVAPSLDAQHARIAARPRHGVGADHLVVCAIQEASRCHVGEREKLEQFESDLVQCAVRSTSADAGDVEGGARCS